MLHSIKLSHLRHNRRSYGFRLNIGKEDFAFNAEEAIKRFNSNTFVNPNEIRQTYLPLVQKNVKTSKTVTGEIQNRIQTLGAILTASNYIDDVKIAGDIDVKLVKYFLNDIADYPKSITLSSKDPARFGTQRFALSDVDILENSLHMLNVKELSQAHSNMTIEAQFIHNIAINTKFSDVTFIVTLQPTYISNKFYLPAHLNSCDTVHELNCDLNTLTNTTQYFNEQYTHIKSRFE